MEAIVKKTESNAIKPYLDWSFKYMFGTEESTNFCYICSKKCKMV